ncbi:hypothetical protein RRG08_057611 [Elysia crispata]|uniref:Uncharacterized protein n=1 Tax=Elysia crispata TaxID=231223 RepID=A0AAE1CKM8_9GAST|nr:hypothetical protein RRG08_057611 [Elysia crispata]
MKWQCPLNSRAAQSNSTGRFRVEETPRQRFQKILTVPPRLTPVRNNHPSLRYPYRGSRIQRAKHLVPYCKEDPLTEQISNLRSKSVSLVDNVASSGTQAQLHKPTSLSLSDVTPISHNCSVSCDSELDRAQQNGSMESGIFAECTPCDSLVLLKPTEIKSPLTVLPLSASLTQNSKHYPYVDVSGCVSLEKLNPGELIVDGASPAIALVNHTDPQPSQLSSVSSAPTITIENLVDSAVCDTESTTLSDC